ncbi:hypothetical protein JI435_403220, partial [Parastagonospora nodorum SN15]
TCVSSLSNAQSTRRIQSDAYCRGSLTRARHLLQ